MSDEILQEASKNATDIQILKVVVGNHANVKIDCSEIWVNVEIYESIYNNILTGSITINDSINMIRNAPIIGKETLEITFKTPSTEPIIKKFAVYDMSVKQRIPGKQDVIYTLQFASIQYLLDYRRKVSRAYKNTKISKIAEKVFEDYLFDFSAEDEEVENAKIESTSDTGSPTTLVIPNWTPLQTMNWLASKAEYYGNCDYMFYETMEGFFFTPLSLLKTKNPVTTYQYTSEPVKEEATKNLDKEMRKITSYVEVQNGCNKSEMEMEGVFTSLGISYDITFKKIQYNIFSYIKDYQDPNTISLSSQPILPLTTVKKIAPQSKLQYFQKASFSHNKIKNQYDVFNSQRRKSHLLKNNAKVLKLEFPGDSRRRVGQVINVEITSPEFLKSKDDASILDGHLSGKYLITAVGHHISKNDGYFMGIEVVRDSFEEAYPDEVTIGNGS